MSYLASIELDREPFSTSPDPKFFYRSSQHYTILNRLEISIRLRRGLSLVLGDVGTGKTTLLRTLLQAFSGEDGYIFHMILDPAFDSDHEFLVHLTKIFGIEVPLHSTSDYREAIEKYLFHRCIVEKRKVVLLIDEGQKLSLSNLEILRTLLNYETNEYKMLQLVILGQMELLLRTESMPNFMDRISLKYIIYPLDEYETNKLIEYRLKQAGYVGGRSLFSYEAIRKIHAYTQGYPRKIARICHNALEQLLAHDYELITAELIEQQIEWERSWQ